VTGLRELLSRPRYEVFPARGTQLQQAEQWRRAALERTGIDKPLLAG